MLQKRRMLKLNQAVGVDKRLDPQGKKYKNEIQFDKCQETYVEEDTGGVRGRGRDEGNGTAPARSTERAGVSKTATPQRWEEEGTRGMARPQWRPTERAGVSKTATPPRWEEEGTRGMARPQRAQRSVPGCLRRRLLHGASDRRR